MCGLDSHIHGSSLSGTNHTCDLTVYSLMILFGWLVRGGDQERTKDVELIFAATSASKHNKY